MYGIQTIHLSSKTATKLVTECGEINFKKKASRLHTCRNLEVTVQVGPPWSRNYTDQ